MRKLIIIFFLFIIHYTLSTNDALANNIAVSNVTITDQSTSAQTCKVQFDISWNNSWRNAINYDAVWVFIKYSTDNRATWAHATLKTACTNPTNFSQGTGTGLDIVVPTDKKGAFLQRTSNGSGSVSTSNIQFVWDRGADGISASSTVRVKVFCLEMVYIPQGAFYAGSGGTGRGEFTSTQITTADASASGGYPTGQTAPNASWPNGYNAFYLMKYEFSQGMWVDFFNTLTARQKKTRDITSATGKSSDGTVYRNSVSWTSGDASAGANQYVACNYLSWQDVVAFADWAGLRPMTELEYEKAARGTASAVADEYAWGSTTITQVTAISNGGASNETASNSGNGLCVYGNNVSVQGPMRSGFAATATATRSQAGASYYGVMELSGNLWERPVTIGEATGRVFTGAPGDGALDANGDANVSNWPFVDAVGSGLRGGTWSGDAAFARVSDRVFADLTYAGSSDSLGARCARTSP